MIGAKFYQSIHSSLCDLTVYANDCGVVGLKPGIFLESNCPNCITEKSCIELSEYFLGQRTDFDVPVILNGTVFQLKVWRALTEIPYGERVSYKYIADKIGSPNAFRAVGNANHKNPIPIIVPCHRVICSSGALGGYALSPALKQRLSELESKHSVK